MIEFRDIPGWEGYYQVSNFGGMVKSLSRVIYNGINYDIGLSYYRSKEKILRAARHKSGYFQVSLNKFNTKKSLRVNRLVLLAFAGSPPPGKNLAMHLDDNPANNDLSNLQWGSYAENNQHCWDVGRNVCHLPPNKIGGEHAKAKKVIQLNKTNLEVIALFGAVREAGRFTNTESGSIIACCKGKLQTAGGYKWKYG